MLKVGRFVHFAAFDVDPAHERAFDQWFQGQEAARVSDTTGMLAVTRYRALAGAPSCLLWYELSAPDPYNAAVQDGAPWATALGEDLPVEHALYEQVFPDHGVYQGVEWGDGSTPVGGLRCTRVDPKPEYEDDVTAWYHQEHNVLLARCPGAIGARRFRAVEGSPKYMNVVYLSGPDVMDQHRSWTEASQTAWTKRLVPAAFARQWGARYQPY